MKAFEILDRYLKAKSSQEKDDAKLGKLLREIVANLEEHECLEVHCANPDFNGQPDYRVTLVDFRDEEERSVPIAHDSLFECLRQVREKVGGAT